MEKAPLGMEGGNSRFCGQIIRHSDNKEATLAYNNAMAGDFDVDEELMDVYAEGLTQTRTMLRDFFGVPDENFLDWKRDSSAQPLIGMFVPKYPELEGGDELHVLTVSDSVCNSALWKVYRNKVLSMSDSIDVWYNSPASSLFQDPVSKAVIGVEVDRNGDVVNVRAKNGVVTTMGGFENNPQMVEDFLGLTKSSPAGTLFNTGDWVNPKRPRRTYMVYDQAQADAIAGYHGIPEEFQDQVVSADTLAGLEQALGMPEGKLQQTVADFNRMAEEGYGPAFYRAADTMKPFGDGPFCAIEMIQAFLNTQGGPRRSARAEVMGTDGDPIPTLYSAGEFGGMTPYQYNGGGNMAECLIFGQLAGVNAAAEKDPLPVLPLGVESNLVYTPGSGSHMVDPDPKQTVTLGENEYLGTSTLCMGNELALKVKIEGGKITAIDVVQQQETAGVGSKAIDALPAKIIEAQSTDAIAGATVTSGAIKDAVQKVLDQVK